MPEEGEEKTYTLVTKPLSGEAETLASSHHYDGQGTAYYANGDTYSGTFVAGRRTGKGKYTFKNGDVYDGCYRENRKHGLGRMVFANTAAEDSEEPPRGGEYHGEFQNRLRHGQGTFLYLNGDSYRGAWKDGFRHGEGTYEYSGNLQNTKLVGEWKQGKIVSGRWVLANGAYFVGAFKNNKPSGKGIWVLPNGNQVVGTFTQTVTQAEEADQAPSEVSISFKSGEPTAVCG